MPSASALVDAVAAWRAAGWFAGGDAPDTAVAEVLAVRWRDLYGDDIASPGEPLDLRLVVLDADRTLVEDSEADVAEGNEVYVQLLLALACRLGADVGQVEEDWASRPGQVVVGFHWRGSPRQIVLPDAGDYIHPGIVTGLNELMSPEDSQLWFVDNGGQQFIVTRATVSERAALQSRRPVRLDRDPPAWWLETVAD